VLFNTLAYARFFVLVFVASWMLMHRRYALLLPWLGLAGYAVFTLGVPWFEPMIHGQPVHASFQLLAAGPLVATMFGLTLWLARRQPVDREPSLSSICIGFASNLSALTWLVWSQHHLDPLTLAARAISFPVPHLSLLRWGLFGAVAVACALLARARRIRLLFLVAASYVFYAHWDYRFLPLIWGSSTIDWLLGRAIGRSADSRRRKLWLVGTVVINLSVLGFFKYFNFGVDNARALAEALGVHLPESTLRIALPVGISFFTFESMSYVIDVYRRKIEPHQSYLEYLGFVAFFPHLVAGPIIRPRDLLPQLAAEARFNPDEMNDGLYLIAAGLLKKVAIGDTLAINIVDRVFDAPLQYSGLENYVAVVAYALQIYCDFSGYTDIAIGSAQLLGIKFPINFNAPYQATTIDDFWHRWHISLSSWLRDYLYISLGGNRKGSFRTYLNLILTMLLGGLWHGANWTFVVWGGIHGGALAVTRLVERWRGNRPALADRHFLLRVLSIGFTFHLVCVGWIFFRAETFGKAALVFSRIASFTTYHPNLPPLVMWTIAVGLVLHFIPVRWDQAIRARFVRLPAPVQGLCLLLAAVLLRQMATAEAVTFIYFQF
jgi:alginate O-acetyltransferase complex protein AlgI